MSDAARDYQRQITQTPNLGTSLVEYRVTDPKTDETALFDGCAYWSPEHELLEAKYGYGDLLEAAAKYGYSLSAEKGEIRQAERQFSVVGRIHPFEWHASDPRSIGFEGVLAEGAASSNFSLKLTPAR